MGSAAKLLSAENENPEAFEILNYRPHIRATYSALKWISILSFVLAGIFFVLGMVLNIQDSMNVIAGIVAASGLSSALQSRFLFRPLAQSHVKLFSDHAVLMRMQESIPINFSEVERVDLSHVGYAGGWFSLKLKSHPRAFRFTIVLENSDRLLEAIYLARPELFPKIEKYHGFIRTAIYCSHSWDRFYEGKIRRWQRMFLKYCLPSGVGAIVVWAGWSNMSRSTETLGLSHLVGFWIVLSILSMVFGYGLFLLKEVLLARSFHQAYSRDSSLRKRNFDLEFRLNKIFIRIYFGFAILVLGLLALTALNLL